MVARDIELPELHIGDVLVYLDAGAYVSEYGVAFNGFPTPEIIKMNTELIADTLPALVDQPMEAVLAIA